MVPAFSQVNPSLQCRVASSAGISLRIALAESLSWHRKLELVRRKARLHCLVVMITPGCTAWIQCWAPPVCQWPCAGTAGSAPPGSRRHTRTRIRAAQHSRCRAVWTLPLSLVVNAERVVEHHEAEHDHKQGGVLPPAPHLNEVSRSS